jgi:hypothetical protein
VLAHVFVHRRMGEKPAAAIGEVSIQSKTECIQTACGGI